MGSTSITVNVMSFAGCACILLREGDSDPPDPDKRIEGLATSMETSHIFPVGRRNVSGGYKTETRPETVLDHAPEK